MHQPPANFDRLAPFYRAMEFLSAGGKLQRCRLEFLHDIPPPRRILLAGEGHGRSLPAFATKFPEAEITVVDSSARMLEITRGSMDSPRVEFVNADLLEWQAEHAAFDLIVTNFFLDCFPPEPLAAVVSRLGKWAAPEADWLLADFQVADAGVARWRSRMILTLLYRFFSIVTGLRASALAPPDAELEKAGFTLLQRQTSDWGLLKSEWWRRPHAEGEGGRTGRNTHVTCGAADTGL